MAVKGIALCIGLNEVNPAVYKKAGDEGGPGVKNELSFAEQNARAMLGIAQAQQFRQITMLLTDLATRGAVETAIENASRRLEPGDMFLLTFSGHGTRVPDGVGGNTGDTPPEADGLDEAWCLYDGLLLDDDLQRALAPCLARERVRILLISDSCYNGTIVERPPAAPKGTRKSFGFPSEAPKVVLRSLADYLASRPRPKGDSNLRQPATKLILNEPSGVESTPEVRAPTLCFTASQDDSTTKEVMGNGKFTKRLLAVWNEGAFDRTYAAFRAEISAGLENITPTYYWLDKDNTFETETPFRLSPALPPAAGGAPRARSPHGAPSSSPSWCVDGPPKGGR